jgi:hypothetical protein
MLTGSRRSFACVVATVVAVPACYASFASVTGEDVGSSTPDDGRSGLPAEDGGADARVPDSVVEVPDGSVDWEAVADGSAHEDASARDADAAEAACTPACTGGCDGVTCTVDCDSTSWCQGSTISCPPGLTCVVHCGGMSACQETTILCPPDAPCEVDCNNTSACQGMTVACPEEEACTVSCDGLSACQGGVLLCGRGACTATCDGPSSSLDVQCKTSCCCTTNC